MSSLGVEAPKRLLFLALSYRDVASDSNMYSDLARALCEVGHDVRVVAPAVDSRQGWHDEGGVRVLRVPSGRLFRVNILQKALENVLLPLRFGRAIARHIGDWRPEWILVPTPPITLTPLVERLKRRYRSNVYLILRDVFPQNAVDLGMIRKGGLLHMLLRHLERRTYACADQIGCMSPANIAYVQAHNPTVPKRQVHLLPNWMAVSDEEVSAKATHIRHGNDTGATRQSPHVVHEPCDSPFVCVFGGNLGQPQQPGFVLDLAEALSEDPRFRFIIVGDGTERGRLVEQKTQRQVSNVEIHERLPRDDYLRLLQRANLGIITLNEAFTIPNIPSRLLAYWAAALPVLAAVDSATDLGSAFLERHDAGMAAPINDLERAKRILLEFANDRVRTANMGRNGRLALSSMYSAAHAAQRLTAMLHMHSQSCHSTRSGLLSQEHCSGSV